MKYKMPKSYLIFILLMIISLEGIGYFLCLNYLLKRSLLNIEKEFSTTKTFFLLREDSLKKDIDSLTVEKDDFEQKYNSEKSKMDLFASQISGIEGTVGFLEKLSKTDPELLKKYSKIYFLNENYIPETLVKIPPEYTFNPEKDYFFYSKTWSFLQNMLTGAASENIDIKIISAYRSFGVQSEIKSTYEIIYGSGASQFSADQGYSEHQLGTTIDFTTSEIGSSYSGFEKTAAYSWLSDNAYKYGFILSYPKDNSYYQFEPWHWRFVGRSLAEMLHQEGKNFYDLDQRDIDQYLLFFFD